MNELQVFERKEFGRVRTLTREGEPWFVAADVCKALELGQVTRAVSRLDDDERGLFQVTHPQSPAHLIEVNAVNEPGLYTLVLGSRKPEARAFKRWITHEVIPAIRKRGAYMTPATIDNIVADPDFGIRLLSELKQEREARQRLEEQSERDAPKVLFADSVAASRQSILIGELAKLLKQNGVDIGQNRLFRQLREEGYLGKQGEYYNMPTQRAMEMKLFEIKESTVTNPDGSIRLTRTTKVSGKGQVYFINRFLGRKAAESILEP